MSDPIQTVDEPEREQAPPVASLPRHIGRYRVERILGEGGFGLVYLAHDDQLQRLIAIKVPHRRLVSWPEEAEAFLTEARTVAGLDHPNIVPVYDVGSTENCPCLVVSKFIDGSNLKAKTQTSRLSLEECIELVAAVAEALCYAHKQGIVHRDIKPSNILLDKSGKPFVADFGLALREQDVGKGPRYAGTPAYMSPEQARGEGHRVDGRSDIFSLGVVLYELLVRRQPFRANSQADLLEQITSCEPHPPRQYDDSIPKELERICLKALSKRASERYLAAKDMADDLRHFLAGQTFSQQSSAGMRDSGSPSSTPATSVLSGTPSATPTFPTSDSLPVKIVPKGLRCFDAHDADFFLGLLPGPRDREGLPESIRFWKTRIEETDADNTFTVGLIYGPSGCGKSSLVKAGLLPRLSDNVIVVYVEATADETEARLLNGLRKPCPALSDKLSLKETLAALRRGHGIPIGKKVLIVLDQFEQWLHARRDEEAAELVQALRQCEGGRVQCIVMVRDDFWLAVSRFMKAMEIEILEGRNSALIDLFDPIHACKVLAAFGRAYRRLSDNPGQYTKEQDEFLAQAISGLAQDGKVISVRLALFAEMVKGKPWTPATLNEVGGTEGVGVTFLEETFAASTAPPQHRLHQKAAQALLKALLPDAGTDIKGHMRSQQELLAASGYRSHPKDFDDLIRILDGELRLITPCDPEASEDASNSPPDSKPPQKYYELSHDYLVHSLRDWLTRKRKETRRGRAELCLAERGSLWNAKSEKRQLPALWEWANIRLFTRQKDWTPPQRKMMRKAARYYLVRASLLVAILVLLILGRSEIYNRLKAQALRDSLLASAPADVPGIVNDMAPYRRWLDPLLYEAYVQAEKENHPRKQLHASLALLPVDAGQVKYLYGRLLDAEPGDPVIRDALAPHKDELLNKLWAVVEKPEKGKESQRLRAAAALALYDPESEKWTKANALVVNDLVLENAVFLGQWSKAFRPVKNWLIPALSEIFRDHKPERTAERSLATNILAEYVADQPQVLGKLLMDADEKQFAVIFSKFKDGGEQGLPILTSEIGKNLPPDLPSSDDSREKLAKRQANAAVALLKMNQPEKVWPLLKHSDDPRVRSYLIHWFGPLGADSRAIVKRLDKEPDVTIRRALILSLGEFGEKDWAVDDRNVVREKLQDIYCTAADPGLHASAEWLLRDWKQDDWLRKVNDEWAKDQKRREKKVEGIKQTLVKEKENTPPQWYVNGKGQTMVVIPGPVDFMMGSPPGEKGRSEYEPLHRKRIGRTFALTAKPVTVEQYRQFDKINQLTAKYTRTADLPVVGTNWHMAAAYCNWLSKEEGIDENQWCYEINGQVTKLKENYLSLSGYRLPTESEMEYATRARAFTSRYYGETEDLLPKYAWYTKNSKELTWPVGSLKPNDLGLFDMQGNVFTWCQESYKPYPAGKGDDVAEDKEDGLVIAGASTRVLRGGSFFYQASSVRSANRNTDMPTHRNDNSGFRVARTFR